MRYAMLDKDGAVIGERETDDPIPPHKSEFFRPLIDEAPELLWWQTIAGHSFEVKGGTVTKIYQVIARPLDQVKRRRKNEVDALLLEKGEQGIEFPAGSGKFVQLRPQDQPNIVAIAFDAFLVKSGIGAWPANFAWRMADNSFAAVATPDDMIALATACKAAVLAARKVAWAHKDAIGALDTAEAVAAYDITAGW